MREKYNHIIEKIEDARKSEDLKAVRRWTRKLEKWQLAYGAYAPSKVGI